MIECVAINVPRCYALKTHWMYLIQRHWLFVIKQCRHRRPCITMSEHCVFDLPHNSSHSSLVDGRSLSSSQWYTPPVAYRGLQDLNGAWKYHPTIFLLGELKLDVWHFKEFKGLWHLGSVKIKKHIINEHPRRQCPSVRARWHARGLGLFRVRLPYILRKKKL